MKYSKQLKLLREKLSWVVLIAGLFAFRWSFADQYQVPTGSMIPTIEVGDHLFVNKMAYDLRLPFTEWSLFRRGEPERGTVVVFRYPENPSQTYVKRVVGLPGDHIRIRNGWIEVNGAEPEILKISSGTESRWLENLGGKFHLVQRIPKSMQGEEMEFTVPANRFFAMGDNRDNSSDSRVWGFVPRSHLKGKVIGIWYSLDWSQGLVPRFRWERTLTGVILKNRSSEKVEIKMELSGFPRIQ